MFLKSDVSTIDQKVSKYLDYFCEEIYHQSISSKAQSDHKIDQKVFKYVG